jgi:hypothetical protein
LRLRAPRDVAIPAGQSIYANDIADIERVEILDADNRSVSIPADCGVVFIFSHRWRKGVFFDFSVFNPKAGQRQDDLPRLFGQYLARLAFQELYSATEEQWQRQLGWGWFPFIGLTHQDRVDLLRLANFDRDPRPFLEPMCQRFAEDLEGRLATWQRNDLLAQHVAFLREAISQYRAKNYMSCLAVLLPRIEGVLRSLFIAERAQEEPSQVTMVSNLVENQHAHSLLLPARFEQYLRRVYFRAFDQRVGNLELSRNSHGHGVSRADDYDLIRATVGFLTLDQIYYYLSD